MPYKSVELTDLKLDYLNQGLKINKANAHARIKR